MNDPVLSEPLFEIVMHSAEPERNAAIARFRTSGPAAVRPERWMVVTHLLVLLALAGLVVCIVGLVRLSRSPDVDHPLIARASILEAAVTAPPPPPIPDPLEPGPPALAPQPGAEGPPSVGSKPQAAPPAPVFEPLVDAGPPLEFERDPAAAEVRAAAAEEADVRKLIEDAKSHGSENPAQAVMRYRKIIDRYPERTELWKSMADLELGRGAVAEAALAYRAFLRAHPDRVDALQNLAILELRAGRTDDARTCLEAAIKSAPSADLYYNLGNLHLKIQGVEAAAAAYRRALEYEPRHAEARFNLALALERSGRRAEAVSALSQLGPVSPEVARERARMEAMMGGLEAARALDLARASQDVELVLGVSSGFRQAGELEKALALLDRAVELAPKHASVRLNRGVVRQAMGRMAEAAADYEEAAGLDPSLSEARFNLGVLAEERGQYVAALGHYASALKVDPAMACALNNVGALYLKVGQAEKAVDYFRRCRTSDATFAPARLNMAWAYLALGSKELARSELKSYVLEVPKEKRSPDAARVLAELDRPEPKR
jgi:tetratricopeptide (TPR) repeat protein